MSMLFTSVNSGLLVLIWIVQIIIYPGMHGWDREKFKVLHRDYVPRISLIVVPLILAQAALALGKRRTQAADVEAILQVIEEARAEAVARQAGVTDA